MGPYPEYDSESGANFLNRRCCEFPGADKCVGRYGSMESMGEPDRGHPGLSGKGIRLLIEVYPVRQPEWMPVVIPGE